jgi:hypothetical protein
MRELKETVAALGAGVAIAAFVACGGSAKSAMTPTTAAPAGSPGTGGDLKAQITALDDKINLEFAKLDAGARPPPPVVASDVCPTPPCTSAVPTAVKPSDDPTCTHGESQTCKDTCQIADAICEAATSICKIAAELNNDAWATEKCASGNASCEKSRGKCCGCL